MNATSLNATAAPAPAMPNFDAERQAAAVAPAEFTFGGRAIRVIQRDGESWFVATDVATALGYASPKDAAEHLDADEKGSAIARTPGGEQRVTVINESGLYALVLRSRKPEARKFAKWVTSEVLPSIRKTGAYARQEYSVNSNQTLTAGEAETLRLMLTRAADRVPKQQQGKLIMQGWSKLKAHFHCSYRDIPRQEFSEAVSILSRHAAEWEVVDDVPSLQLNHAKLSEAIKISGHIAEDIRRQVFHALLRVEASR